MTASDDSPRAMTADGPRAAASARDDATRASPSRWLPRALPFLAFIALLGAGDLLREPLAGAGIDVRYLAWVRAIVVGGLLCWALPRCPEWREAPRSARSADPSRAMWIESLMTGAAVFALWVALRAPWMTIGDAPAPATAFDASDAQGLHWPHVIVRLILLAIIVPIMEELFWRSFVLRRLESPAFSDVDPAAVRAGSLAIVSIAFALEHREWLAGLLAGLAYGLLYRRHRALPAPIVAHAATNLLLGVWILGTGQWELWR